MPYLIVSVLYCLGFYFPGFGAIASSISAAIAPIQLPGPAFSVFYAALNLLPIIYSLNLLVRRPETAELQIWRNVFRIGIAAMIACLPWVLLVDVFSGPAAGWKMLGYLGLLCLLIAGARSITMKLHGIRGLRPISIFLLAPVVASAYSLLVLITAPVGAYMVAGGNDYCIATPYHGGGQNEDYGPIKSWQELRGVELATDRTGYKDTDTWYFHALLLTRQGADIVYWNWSFASLRWQPAEFKWPKPGKALACEPQVGFLSHLNLLAETKVLH
jgi:hypothetical protein